MLPEVYTDNNAHSNESFVVYSRTVLLHPLFMKVRIFLRGRGVLEFPYIMLALGGAGRTRKGEVRLL